MKMAPQVRVSDDVVTFNVRGHTFQTTLTNLRQFPESVLYKMVGWERKNITSAPQESTAGDAFFIDRDADLFAAILRYYDTNDYTDGSLEDASSCNTLHPVTPKSLLLEQYYNIQSLEQKIRDKRLVITDVQYEL